MSASLMKLLDKALRAAQEYGEALGQEVEHRDPEQVEDTEKEYLKARDTLNAALAKVLPADPRAMHEVIVLADHQYGDMVMTSVAEQVPGKDFIRSLMDTLLLGKDGRFYRLGLAILPADEKYVERLDKEGICTHTREHTCHHCLEEE